MRSHELTFRSHGLIPRYHELIIRSHRLLIRSNELARFFSSSFFSYLGPFRGFVNIWEICKSNIVFMGPKIEIRKTGNIKDVLLLFSRDRLSSNVQMFHFFFFSCICRATQTIVPVFWTVNISANWLYVLGGRLEQGCLFLSSYKMRLAATSTVAFVARYEIK